MQKSVKYQKDDQRVELGKNLYHSRFEYAIVKEFETDHIVCKVKKDAEVRLIKFPWCDLGKVLFFSKEDYMKADDEAVAQKYAIYQNASSWSDVEKSIALEDKRFFEGKSYHEKELHMERLFFDKVEKSIKGNLDSFLEQEKGFSYNNNGNSETYDIELSKARTDVEENKRRYMALYDEPYFAKIKLKNESAIYIGNIGKENIGENIFDSRNKKYAPLYYQYEFHKAQLDLVRHILIKHSNLQDYVDKFNAISEEDPVLVDELLAKIIEYNREEKDVVNIAQSIQSKQYDIISKPSDENLLVEGCAGSGKTMVLLHRLSSIIFNESSDFKQSDLIIISPNNILDNQSTPLLAELDLSKTTKGSIRSLYIQWIQSYIKSNNVVIGEYNSLERPVYDNTQTYGDVINVLYQEDIATDFDEILKTVVDNPLSKIKGFNFIEVEKQRIETHQAQVYGGVILSSEPLYLLFKEFAEEYDLICKSLSKNNIQAKLKSINERIDALSPLQTGYNVHKLKKISDDYSAKYCTLEELLKSKKSELVKLCVEIETIEDGISPFEKMMSRERKKRVSEKIDTTVEDISATKKELLRIKKEGDSQIKRLYNDKEIQTLKKQCAALELLLEVNDLKGIDVKTKDGKFSIAEPLYRGAFDFYARIESKIPAEILELNGTVGNFLHNNYIAMDRINRYDEFLAGNKESYLIDLIESIMWFYKDEFDVNNDAFYEFELYYILRGLQLEYGMLEKGHKIVSIDEYQDYSPIEIELIEKMFPQCSINLYGEILQNINEKGVTSINDKHYRKYERINLDTNYRNGKEITMYINQQFKTQMKAIGISSSVNNVHVTALEKQKFDEKKRVALIVKSLELYEALEYNKKNDNVFIDDTISTDRRKLNVIPIKLAKGLEFEVVYVYEKEMTNNERYVACSRALEELNIVQ